MVGEDMKIMSFQEVSEMFDGEVDSEQFPIKSAVSGLSWFHLLGEKGDGMPCTIDVLL